MAQPFVFSLDIAGDKQLQRGLSRFGEDVKDLREPFREIVKDFHEIERKQFDSEGGYGSGGWKALAPSTLKQKERAGFPTTIMVRTGKLKESLISKTGDTVEEVRPLELRVGTEVSYAIYHQSTTPRTKLPRRPLIDLTEADKKRWMKIFQRYLVKEMKKEFAGLMPTIGVGKSHVGGI